MTINYPGPYELRIYYTNAPLVHSMRLNVSCSPDPTPGDLFSAINALQRNTNVIAMSTLTDNWITLIKPLFHTGIVFNYAELWKYTAGTFEAEFISTYDINVQGTSATSPVPAGQQILSFRTIEGGVLKMNFMEASRASGLPVSYPSLTTQEKAVVDAVLAVSNAWKGRDTSFPFAFIRCYPGTNEALFKRRYRET